MHAIHPQQVIHQFIYIFSIELTESNWAQENSQKLSVWMSIVLEESEVRGGGHGPNHYSVEGNPQMKSLTGQSKTTGLYKSYNRNNNKTIFGHEICQEVWREVEGLFLFPNRVTLSFIISFFGTSNNNTEATLRVVFLVDFTCLSCTRTLSSAWSKTKNCVHDIKFVDISEQIKRNIALFSDWSTCWIIPVLWLKRFISNHMSGFA